MEEKKALKDLNLINRFLFAEVMDDPEVNQDALSIILGQNVRLLSSPQTEKEHRVSPLAEIHTNGCIFCVRGGNCL